MILEGVTPEGVMLDGVILDGVTLDGVFEILGHCHNIGVNLSEVGHQIPYPGLIGAHSRHNTDPYCPG